MQVKQILDKICEQNASIHGALVRANDRIHHNFSGIYEAIDIESVADMAEQALMLTRSLEAEDNIFNTVFFEYEQHSLLVREIDGGLFILLTNPIERDVYRKMKIGINLFIKRLSKVLEQEPEDAVAVAAAPAINGTARPEPMVALRDEVQKAQLQQNKKEQAPKKKRFYRGQEY